MGLRQREWAKAARLALIKQMGAKCAHCGSKKHLTCDCIKPMGDRHHRMEMSQRVSFYRRQFAEGNLQALCRHCNEIKAATTDQLWFQMNPF